MSNLAYINDTNKINKPTNTNKIIIFPGNKNMTTPDILVGIPDKDDYDEEVFSHEHKTSEVFAFKTDEDIKKMSAYFASRPNRPNKWRNILMFTIGCNIGLRAGDLLQLQWKHVIQNNEIVDSIFVKEGKTKKVRKLSFNNSCKQAILSHLDHTFSSVSTVNKEDYLFKSREGNSYILVSSASRILKEAAKAVGIKYNIGTHSMRKTFGYNAYKVTNNIDYVQKLFGHSSSSVTLRYIGIDDDVISDIYQNLDIRIDEYVHNELLLQQTQVIK